MGNTVLITEADGSTTQKGVWRSGTQAEVDAGTAGVVVTADTLKNFSFSQLPIIRFNSNILLQTNHAHALVSEDVVDVITCELPARATFNEGDIIECDDVSGFNFKIVVTGDTLLRIDDTLISDIDGKFLISAGRGSSIKLRALNGQLWYVVRRDRVTVSS